MSWLYELGIRGTILVILGLLAAFDSINHSILLSWLHGLRIWGSILWWFSSFLWNWFQCLLVSKEKPSSKFLIYGVLQGFSLFPLFFNIYMEVICWFGSSVK